MKTLFRLLASGLLSLSILCFGGCRDVIPTGAGREHGRAPVDPSTITICVDAGHGFDDIGTSSAHLGDVTEKEINLAMAFHLRDALMEAGFQVILTHDGETFPETEADDGNNVFSPSERISYADTVDIDYFISLHCDSYPADASVHGLRVYYSKGTSHSRTSAAAVQAIAQAVDEAYPDAKQTRIRDMARSEAYYVIREADVPSSLVEIGFVTHEEDAARMLDDTWRKGTAEAIAEGLCRFFTE